MKSRPSKPPPISPSLFLLPSLLLVLLTSFPLTSLAQSPDIVVRISEEESVGFKVLDVSDYPQLFLEVSYEDRTKLNFNILDKESFPASLFAIAASTGVITVGSRIDREQVCPDAGDHCFLEFSVAITGTGGLSFSNIASVKVNVDDINDNAPNFAADQVVLNITEGAKVGTKLKLDGPVDLDSLTNNTVQRLQLTPNLQPSAQVFNLSYTKNPDGTSFVFLSLTSVLDRETVNQYDFNIIAYDGGEPPKSDFLRVIVNVTDENDNVPVFQQASYDVSVSEDDPVGSEVVRVTATDRDAGAYGTVRYRFSTVISDAAKRLFRIDNTTGVISLQAAPSTATSPNSSPYTLIVEAYDGGSPPSVEQVVVTITILNTGNNAPRVRIVTVNEGATTEIHLSEAAQVDGFVAFVNVDDNDSGDSGKVTCSMVNGASQFRIAELPNKGYRMLLSKAVDRETTPSYQGSILCRDGGTPPLSTQVEFTVTITDINDNAPKFEQSVFEASLTENSNPGLFVLQVVASDKDDGDNAKLTFSFVEPEAQTYLSIHPQTGLVSARLPLDREVTPILRYTVKAVDGGTPPKSGTAGLVVTVKDLNDNAPQLQGTPYHFSVSEGVSPGFVVGSMSATDLDEGRNGQVEFYYTGSIYGEVPFTVHLNGTIEVNGVLDRETSDTHVFTILARDKGAIPKSNSTQVTVTVTDINDNPPVILFPTSINHSVVITTLPENGIVLGRIIAYDVDTDNASSLTYSLTHTGDENGVFEVEKDTGKIYLADVRKLNNPHVYHVLLSVHDRGVPPLSANTTLQIEVNYPNRTEGAGSGQQAESEGESRETYVVIVAVIGGGTVVLSGIIIGAICFVLRQERRRKAREGSAMKNEYVPAPTKITSPEKTAPIRLMPSAPTPPERRNSMSDYSQTDLSTSGVILSAKGLGSQNCGGKAVPEVQKKVSFSLDEPDVDVSHFQSRDLLGASNHHQEQQHHDAWKRLASPDDINSDTSGDSGTCDSGRGASDDDIHLGLDNSMDKHGASGHHHAAPALTNTNRTPAPSNIYSPPAFGSFRQGQGQGRNGQGHYTGAQGQGRPQFLHSSYHEGRADNYRGKEGRRVGGGGGGGIQPPPRGGYPPSRPAPRHQQSPLTHPVPESSWQQQQQQQQNRPQHGSRQSLDFVDSSSGLYGRDSKWLLQPPRPSSSMSYQRQGSVMSADDRDDASTTTSGSYTISPEELRLDGLLSPDVIV